MRQTFCRTAMGFACGAWLALASAAEAQVGEVPAALRERLQLSEFYGRHLDVLGIPIIASGDVSDVALQEAGHLVMKMLEHRPDVAAAIAESGVRIAIMAPNQFTTDIPEHSDLTPAAYWNRRARGLGATHVRPAVSCGEENLLCLPGDPYAAENILIHEFGHVIHQIGMGGVDRTWDRRLRETYEQALAEDLWKGTYAASNHSEYWAEAVQSWFDTNRENDAQHNHVNTRDELREYDPRLAELCADVLGDGDWRYVRPRDRTPPSPHFEGFDVASRPAFEWPAELLAAAAEAGEPTRTRIPAGAAPLVPRPPDASNPPRSVSGGEAATLWIRNRMSTPARLDWIDFDGQSQSYGTVPSGGVHEQSTFTKHVWRLTVADDDVREYVVDGARSRIVLDASAGEADGDKANQDGTQDR
ncbi:MAG: hypothetical protein KF774_04475 [Planctomyces sp.]|nr:hypothetical protein [Planctomyces sp.]